MKTLVDTYIQLGFLDKFYSELSLTTVSDMLLKGENVARIERVFNFINKNAALHLDCLPDLFTERAKHSVYYMHLLKNSQSGGSQLDFLPEEFAQGIENKICPESNPRSFFMLNENEQQANQIKTSYGRYATDCSMLTVDSFCFKNNWTWHVSSDNSMNQFPGWSFTKALKAPSSFVVISDNYILDKTESFSFNIFEILKNILPENLKSKNLNIALIIQEYDLSRATKIYEKVFAFLCSLNLPYKWNIAIFLTKVNDPHDRNIMTNYYWIHSGHSLDYYDKSGKINKKTTLHFHSLVNEMETIQHLIDGFKAIFNNSKEGLDRIGNIEVSAF